jgi:hypothetical protein
LGVPRILPFGIRRALLLTRHGPDCSNGLCLQEEVAAFEATLSRFPTCCEGRRTVAAGQASSAGRTSVPAQCLVPQLRLRRIERVTLRTPRDRPPGRLLIQIAPPVWACAMTGFGRERTVCFRAGNRQKRTLTSARRSAVSDPKQTKGSALLAFSRASSQPSGRPLLNAASCGGFGCRCAGEKARCLPGLFPSGCCHAEGVLRGAPDRLDQLAPDLAPLWIATAHVDWREPVRDLRKGQR